VAKQVFVEAWEVEVRLRVTVEQLQSEKVVAVWWWEEEWTAEDEKAEESTAAVRVAEEGFAMTRKELAEAEVFVARLIVEREEFR
jgi:hypothetical protein